MEINYLTRQKNTQKREQQTRNMIKINGTNKNLLEDINKIVKFYHYDYLGKMKTPHNDLNLYNCKTCHTTVCERTLVDHVIKEHYYNGLKSLRST